MRTKLLVDLLLPLSPSNPKLQAACSLAHKWFMVYYLLVERHLVDLRVTPVSPNCPPSGYKRLHVGRRLPVVLVSRPISVPVHPVLPYARLAELEPEIIAESEDERESLMERWAVPGFVPETLFAPLICDLVLGLKYLLYHGSDRRLQNGLTQLNEILSGVSNLWCDQSKGISNRVSIFRQHRLSHFNVSNCLTCRLFVAMRGDFTPVGRNSLLITLLKTLRHPTTGVVPLRARSPRVSVNLRFCLNPKWRDFDKYSPLRQNLSGKHFLIADHPVYIDCSLAPKLQHLRVAGAYFRGFQIPDTLKYVWMYLSHMYNLEAFRVSCPTDKDILLHYLERIPGLDLAQIDTQKKRIFRLPDACRLFTYPTGIAHEPSEFQNSDDSRTPNRGSQDAVSRLQKYQTQTNLNCEFLYKNSDDASSAVTVDVRGVNSPIERTSSKRFNYLYRQIPPFRYYYSELYSVARELQEEFAFLAHHLHPYPGYSSNS
ncbi:hypothetical protein T265_08713 [Opisthorchis viverrini]|uniref:Uncharacterized protein n=1 Tax=Opisthorchis viverrini TaxID=6198 RepID=A0A074Z8E2_OPIVI|nr:hypothetical protein T265_08713 [Opisthorchis viverrini]KER23388.1 hypothetical protein T265_08713 [Opisthorchis viverrini]